jgi:putative transposase
MYRMCSQDPVCGPSVLRDSGLPVGGRWDEHHVAGSGEGAPRQESGHGVAPGEQRLVRAKRRSRNRIRRRETVATVIARSPISAGTFTTNWLDDSVERYDVLVVEDLQIANMLRRANARRRVPAFQPGERG